MLRQPKTERFLVRHLERLPLGMSYAQQIQHVANLLGREPLIGATFTLDFAGCGRPVADQFQRAGQRPQKVLITAGNEVTHHDGNTWHMVSESGRVTYNARSGAHDDLSWPFASRYHGDE